MSNPRAQDPLPRQVSPSRRRLLTATCFVFIFMSGFSLATCMLGTLLPGIIVHYSLSLTQSSAISNCYEIGSICSLVLGLFVVDRLDKGKLLTSLGLLFGLILILHSTAPAFLLLLAVRVAMGMVGGLLDNLCNSYISDLYGNKRGRYIQLLGTVYSIGSLLAPKFAALCYTFGGWGLAYLVSGVAITATAVLAVFLLHIMGYPPKARDLTDNSPAPRGPIPYRQIFLSRNMLCLCASSFLLAGQTYVTIWLSTYLDWLDKSVYTVELCSTIMTAGYVGSILSRVIMAAVSGRVSPQAYLKWSSLLSSLLFAGLVLWGQPTAWLVGGFVYQLLSGAMFSARVTLACQESPQYSATATSLLGIFVALGNMTFNSLMGVVADVGHYTQAMLGASAVIALTFLIFQFGYKSRES